MKYQFILLILCFVACTQPQKKVNRIEPEIPKLHDYYLTSKDTVRHVVFQFDSKLDSGLFNNTVKASTLSNIELIIIEDLIKNGAIGYNKGRYKPIIQPSKYFKQLIPIINSKGEKEVWISCFCETFDHWKTQRVYVSDGGNCVFHVKINLTKHKIMYFKANGLA